MQNTDQIVDEFLRPYQEQIGKQYRAYKNHVCRLIELCKLQDQKPANLNKYIIAAVFHDIGLWTHKTFDYVPPSMAVAEDYLLENELETAVEEIKAMIYWHHKTTSYTQEFADTVNVFRKADWMDATFGIVKREVNHRELRRLRSLYPTFGFHRFLLKKTIGNFFLHPLRPLPMFKV